MKLILKLTSIAFILVALSPAVTLAGVKKLQTLVYYPIGSGGYTIINLQEQGVSTPTVCFKSTSTNDIANHYAALATASAGPTWFGQYDLSNTMDVSIDTTSGECTSVSVGSRKAAEFGFND